MIAVKKEKIPGDIKDGTKLLLKYIIELPRISGSRADEIINAMFESINERILLWLENDIKKRLIEKERGEGRRGRLYREIPVYRLFYGLKVTDDRYISIRITSKLDGEKGEYTLVICSQDGFIERINLFCSKNDAKKYKNCPFRLTEDKLEVSYKGKVHKIERSQT